MKFSESELLILETLWNSETLDENGEIMAADLSKLLTERYGWPKTSNYAFFGRLLNKGAISRRYPKYTLKPTISRDQVGTAQVESLVEKIFGGSALELFAAFLNERKFSDKDIKEMKELIKQYEAEGKAKK